MPQRLLISWVYYQPVGHAIEAYRAALAFRNVNPDLEIAVALNARSATELAGCVPAVDTTYPVEIEGVASFEQALEAVADIPTEWDYLYCDPRQAGPMGMDSLDHIAHAIRTTRYARMVNEGWQIPEGYPERRLSPLALQLPSAAREFADRFISSDRPIRVSLLLGASSHSSKTPTPAFWRALIRELIAEFAGIEIVLLGALTPGRSTTFGVDRALIDALITEFPEVRDAFDLGLLNQLAIAERCALHISPHTGMSFAVQSVGVPWLALSGGEMYEAVLNGVPFLSIYPACERYPCGPWFDPVKNAMWPECRERHARNEAFLCMSNDRLTLRLPEIMQAARLLIEQRLSYHQCAQMHYDAMLLRLGAQTGDPIFLDWPDVLAEQFIFPGLPAGR